MFVPRSKLTQRLGSETSKFVFQFSCFFSSGSSCFLILCWMFFKFFQDEHLRWGNHQRERQAFRNHAHRHHLCHTWTSHCTAGRDKAPCPYQAPVWEFQAEMEPMAGFHIYGNAFRCGSVPGDSQNCLHKLLVGKSNLHSQLLGFLWHMCRRWFWMRRIRCWSKDWHLGVEGSPWVTDIWLKELPSGDHVRRYPCGQGHWTVIKAESKKIGVLNVYLEHLETILSYVEYLVGICIYIEINR